ncbi:hypothetical protein HX131_17430, partial [Escherichia coli]|nr:hypothetical protein [Escherichia coli]MCK2393067.1 hypothetical protein [Escherichia coli]MCK3031412.1 hypothetical protein [Escherichia coli]MDM1726000.1 hypothetical protein [Escherichia coli]
EKRVFLVILFTSFSGSLVSRIPGAVQGESKNVQLDLGLGDSRSFPIFPSTSGVSGTSEFMLNIEELK